VSEFPLKQIAVLKLHRQDDQKSVERWTTSFCNITMKWEFIEGRNSESWTAISMKPNSSLNRWSSRKAWSHFIPNADINSGRRNQKCWILLKQTAFVYHLKNSGAIVVCDRSETR
jgi:hypothetical protein